MCTETIATYTCGTAEAPHTKVQCTDYCSSEAFEAGKCSTVTKEPEDAVRTGKCPKCKPKEARPNWRYMKKKTEGEGASSVDGGGADKSGLDGQFFHYWGFLL